MYLANQFPTGNGIRGPEDLQIGLGERTLYEIKDQLIVIDSNKLNGRQSTCDSAHFPLETGSFMIYQIS